MKRAYPNCEAREVERRAAEVRRSWSLAERMRRTGLPPDMPLRLRDWSERLPAIGFARPHWMASEVTVVVPLGSPAPGTRSAK